MKTEDMVYFFATHYPYSTTEIEYFINKCQNLKRKKPSFTECKEIIEYAQSYGIGLKYAAIIYYNPNKS